MEYCLETATALKSSLRREYLPQSTQQAIFDDFFAQNSSNIGADDFSVDCFFDFSNGDGNAAAFVSQDEEEVEDEEEEEKDSLSVSSNSNLSAVSDSFLASELAVPDDDLAELEWVSQFVDDSLSQFPVVFPLKPEKQLKSEPQPILTKPLCVFPAKIPAKARSKRPRLTGRTWSSASSFTDSSSSSTASNSISSTEILRPPSKKPKRKPAAQAGGAGQLQRRCSHCQVQKTPQWRTGPLGAKTLCNACGVRYKSGRLFPEYRPACSPTFSSGVHSNSHRKVIEMRKRKELNSPEPGLTRLDPGLEGSN